MVNLSDHIKIIRIGSYEIAIHKISFNFRLHLICSFICKRNHYYPFHHFSQRRFLRITNKTHTGNHRIRFTCTGSGSYYNILFCVCMLSQILLHIKTTMIAKFPQQLFLCLRKLPISDHKRSTCNTIRRIQHADCTMKPGKCLTQRILLRNIFLDTVKIYFYIISFPNKTSLL